jgi:protocatechuate 3,4-dioxygenase beta subunit
VQSLSRATRRATLRVLVALAAGIACTPLLAQRLEFIHPEFLQPPFVVPENAPAKLVIASADEPGARLVVTGRTLDGNTPVAGVSLFVFHTDANGRYAPGMDNNQGELHPRLHGALRTDAQGRYEYETTRPGSYNNGPAHVHYVVTARGYKPLLIALQFDDDPIVMRMRKAGMPLLDPDAFKNGPCKARPDCVLTQPVTRDARGIARVTRDIQMVKE